jgi:cytoskeletal protein CcmA (bactofilin family)
MFKRQENKPSARIDTLIGRSASVQGDVEFSGGLHVDGRITGNVRALPGAASSLSVSEHGVIEGSVIAPHVVLNGAVNGDISASERVALGTKARVRGNVSYGVIEMALGAEISGKLIPTGADAPPSAPTLPAPSLATATLPAPTLPAATASLPEPGKRG